MLPLSFTNSPPRVVYHHLVLFCFIALHPLHYTQLIKSSTTMIYIVIISLVLVNLVYYICIIIIRLYLYVFIISLIFQTPQNWRAYHYPFTFFKLEFTLYGVVVVVIGVAMEEVNWIEVDDVPHVGCYMFYPMTCVYSASGGDVGDHIYSTFYVGNVSLRNWVMVVIIKKLVMNYIDNWIWFCIK